MCGETGTSRRTAAREMMLGTRGVFDYDECAHCGSLRIAAIPDDLGRFYPPNYVAFRPVGGVADRAKEAVRRTRDRRLILGTGLVGAALVRTRSQGSRDLSAQSLGRLRLHRTARVLDIGCGHGALLKKLHGLGFRNIQGVDAFVPDEVIRQAGVPIVRGTIAGAGGEWDVVMLNHSLEHMPDPFEALRRVRELLAPGGVGVVRVPVAGSAAWDRYGANWVQLDAPRHLTIPSREGMVKLAARAGLLVTDTVDDSTGFQFWGSEQYGRDIPLTSPQSHAMARRSSLFSRRDIRRFEREAGRVNAQGRGDQASFYLRAAAPGSGTGPQGG